MALQRGAAIVATTLLGGLVAGYFTGISVARSDHAVLTSLVDAFDGVPKTYVRADVQTVRDAQIFDLLSRMDGRLERFESKLDEWDAK